jgi:hypothetical protein
MLMTQKNKKIMVVIGGVFFSWKNWQVQSRIFSLEKLAGAIPHFFLGKIEILFLLLLLLHGVKHITDVSTILSSRILWSFPFHLVSGYSWYNYSWIFPVSQVGTFSSSEFVGSNRASSSGAYT